MNQINIPHKLRILNSNQEIANELLNIIDENGFSKIAFITSQTPSRLLTSELETALSTGLETHHCVHLLKTFQVINASIAYVNQLPLNGFDLVVGVGGGKVIDTAKYAAHINKIPCISIPTSVSNDGICSPIAVLKEKQNKHKSLGASIPIALLVPLHLIEQSDEETIVSGIGDLLSNLSAIEDWKLANKETGEFIDDYAVMISKQAALSVFTEIKNYILQRKTKEQFLKENLQTIIEALALSGVAMEIAGSSRPASGAEHLISHSIDELLGGVKPHGIQVAFGMYVSAFLWSELGYIPKNCFEEIRAVLRFLELPTTLSGIGLTKEQLIQVIQHAPNTRVERYTILSKIKFEKSYLNQLIDKLFEAKVAVTLASKL